MKQKRQTRRLEDLIDGLEEENETLKNENIILKGGV
jgi:hypothetical protein